MLFQRTLVLLAVTVISCSSISNDCKDSSSYCRFVTSLCNSSAHKAILRQNCAKTCNFCEMPSLNITENPDDIIIIIANRALDSKKNLTTTTTTSPCANATTPDQIRRCVFERKNAKITTNPPPMAKNSTEEVLNSSKAKAIVSPTANEVLKKFVSGKRTTETNSTSDGSSQNDNSTSSNANSAKEIIIQSNSTKISVVIPSNAELVNSTKEFRKFKLQELMSTADLRLPRVTSGASAVMTISLSKSLIKGTCFDEYVYCREFESLCIHPTFSDIMAAHCTKTCNRCEDVDQSYDSLESDKCEDLTPGCDSYKDVCQHDLYKSLTKQYCQKTCGYCKPKCRDRHQSCTQYADSGFCTDETYTNDEIKFLCGQTCKMC